MHEERSWVEGDGWASSFQIFFSRCHFYPSCVYEFIVSLEKGVISYDLGAFLFFYLLLYILPIYNILAFLMFW